MFHYLDDDAADPYRLPCLETFHLSREARIGDDDVLHPGWYVWPCYPGCLPDGDPYGPFQNEEEALNAVRSLYDDVLPDDE